jgi:hypothetical protein
MAAMERFLTVLWDVAFLGALILPAVLGVLWLAWRAGRPVVRRAWVWGCIVGFVGFAIGFFGPIAWAPDANQGPLLGIFLTGPLAFDVTVLGVLAVGAIRARRGTPTPPS